MKGIIIPCPAKYENICLSNIQKIRDYGCSCLIEIWEAGVEISSSVRDELSKINNVQFKNVADYCDNPHFWKGFQIKVFALYYTQIEECIIIDADVTFFKNPEIIWKDENYIRTGTYFFRDLDKWQFTELSNFVSEQENKFSSLIFYLKRRMFIRKLIPIKTNIFPSEWNYIYEDETPNNVKEAYQESGVVFINKKIHKLSIEYIYQLNEYYPQTYQYVWGDKETFWIGCVMAGNEFYMNPSPSFLHENCLTHMYNGISFWKQK